MFEAVALDDDLKEDLNPAELSLKNAHLEDKLEARGAH